MKLLGGCASRDLDPGLEVCLLRSAWRMGTKVQTEINSHPSWRRIIPFIGSILRLERRGANMRIPGRFSDVTPREDRPGLSRRPKHSAGLGATGSSAYTRPDCDTKSQPRCRERPSAVTAEWRNLPAPVHQAGDPLLDRTANPPSLPVRSDPIPPGSDPHLLACRRVKEEGRAQWPSTR
jgi:hypothetical protein